MNDFCVYWSKNKCTLDKISIDVQGFCEACIYLSVDEDVLDKYRKKTLERLDRLLQCLNECENNTAENQSAPI